MVKSRLKRRAEEDIVALPRKRRALDNNPGGDVQGPRLHQDYPESLAQGDRTRRVRFNSELSICWLSSEEETEDEEDEWDSKADRSVGCKCHSKNEPAVLSGRLTLIHRPQCSDYRFKQKILKAYDERASKHQVEYRRRLAQDAKQTFVRKWWKRLNAAHDRAEKLEARLGRRRRQGEETYLGPVIGRWMLYSQQYVPTSERTFHNLEFFSNPNKHWAIDRCAPGHCDQDSDRLSGELRFGDGPNRLAWFYQWEPGDYASDEKSYVVDMMAGGQMLLKMLGEGVLLLRVQRKHFEVEQSDEWVDFVGVLQRCYVKGFERGDPHLQLSSIEQGEDESY